MVLATGRGVDGVVALTIGMATHNDFNGVYFTLQALRLYQNLRDSELLVVDNYGCPATKQLVEGWVHGARYVLATEVRGTAAAKDRVFREAVTGSGSEAVFFAVAFVLAGLFYPVSRMGFDGLLYRLGGSEWTPQRP
jgi:hypothetical protein